MSEELKKELAEHLARHQAIAMTSGNYWYYLANLALEFLERKTND